MLNNQIVRFKIFTCEKFGIALFPLITLSIGILWPVAHSSPEPKIGGYPEYLTGVFTGGFEEESCRSCHFDYDLNPDGGDLTVSGIPDLISGGESVEIKIQLEREELGRAGFQLSARYDDGAQAGHFDIDANDRVMHSKQVPDSLEYVQHSAAGSKPADNIKTSWNIIWKAPENIDRPVVFNIAANAANGDQSEFGDFIFVRELTAGLQ